LNRQAYFPALTGVRAFATYLVFIQHNRPVINITENFGRDYLNTGHTALTLFFVLSGFLITYRYAEAFEKKKISFSQYFGKRVARIVPLYVLLTVIILIWQRDFNPWHWFLNLTYLKGFFNIERSTGLFQGWTLTVEETFYLLAPLLFIYFRKSALLTFAIIISTGVMLVLIANAFGSDSFFVDIEFLLIYTFYGRFF
jgi:peptidoglycan/LPS O-acetylase OafA/YrhL